MNFLLEHYRNREHCKWSEGRRRPTLTG